MGWLILVLVGTYLGIMLLIYAFQRQMVFHPTKSIYTTPGDLGINYEDVELETEDGLRLHGWFLPDNGVDRTILLFHGNAGNNADRVYFLDNLKKLNTNILIIDYRGYGRSEGTPDEQGIYADGRAAWTYLTEEREIDPSKIILFGRSLGGAVATKLATEYEPGALVLEATFTSGADLGADIYPWLPVRMMIKYDFSNAERIRNISVPVLIAHSRDDRVVPYHHSEKLFEIANEPKVFVEMQGPHGAGFDDGRGHYLEKLKTFLDEYVPKKAGIH